MHLKRVVLVKERAAVLLAEGKVLEQLVSCTGQVPGPEWACGFLPRWQSAQERYCACVVTARAPSLPSLLQVLSLRSRDDAVRAAAVEAAAELTARDRTLAVAVEQPATLSALIDLWEGVTDALTGAGGWKGARHCLVVLQCVLAGCLASDMHASRAAAPGSG